MNALATIPAGEELSEGQKTALLKLLADDDPAVYQAVRSKILSYGPKVAAWLEPHRLSDDAALRRRAQEIVQHFGRQLADTQFLGFCIKHGQDFDLEEGAWLLAKTKYPDINIDGYRALLDNFAEELRDRLGPGQSSRETLATLNDYLYVELVFSSNEKNY